MQAPIEQTLKSDSPTRRFQTTKQHLADAVKAAPKLEEISKTAKAWNDAGPVKFSTNAKKVTLDFGLAASTAIKRETNELDDIRTMIAAMQSNYGNIQGQLDVATAERNEMKGKLEEVTMEHNHMKGKLDLVEGKLDQVEGKLDKVQVRLDEYLNKDINLIARSLMDLVDSYAASSSSNFKEEEFAGNMADYRKKMMAKSNGGADQVTKAQNLANKLMCYASTEIKEILRDRGSSSAHPVVIGLTLNELLMLIHLAPLQSHEKRDFFTAIVGFDRTISQSKFNQYAAQYKNKHSNRQDVTLESIGKALNLSNADYQTDGFKSFV
jgi:hypothetical protein